MRAAGPVEIARAGGGAVGAGSGSGSRAGNWARNVTWTPVEVARPSGIDGLRDVLARARAEHRTVRPAGSRHSFTPLCATEGISLDLGAFSGVRHVDGDLVTVGAGTPLHRLNVLLDGIGRAVANLGDIDRQTVAGAISTGTHGTGARFQGLAGQVESFTLVTASGDEVRATRGDLRGRAEGSAWAGQGAGAGPDVDPGPGPTVDPGPGPNADSGPGPGAAPGPDLFRAALVGLGAFGVVTEVTLRTVPAFGLEQSVAPDSYERIMAGLPERLEADHFEFFWFPLGDVAQVKVSRRMGPGEATAPLGPARHYVEDVLLENATFGALCRVARRQPQRLPQLHRMVGRFISRRRFSDASFRVFATTRSVRFLESEYAVPRAALPEVLDAVGALAQRLPVGPAFPVEVRFAAADDIWLSTGHERDNAYVAVHQYVGMPFEEYFAEFARICAAVGGRPHWGKMHPLDAAELEGLYPRFRDAAALRRDLDPDGLFLNDHLRSVFGA